MRQTTRNRSAMSPEETTFFEQLGRRIAALRKERGLTQVQLADALGISQQQVLSFEKGRRRIPVSALPALAEILHVSVEELLGAETPPTKRGPTPKLQKQLERLQQLPRSQQKIVSQMLEAVLQEAGR